MARNMPGYPSHNKVSEDGTCIYSQDDPPPLRPKWYFTKEEIEEHSPSRKDGIDCEYESLLRQSYCSYIQKLGVELKVPQVTIATALMLCHRFYMHQSHAKNHWQTVANACMFLACKAEETPRWLKNLIVVAYKLMYSWDPLAPQRIRQKEVYDKQKQLIILGERLVLVTVAFDLNIEHPYKPLVAALKRLEISQKEVVQAAWNYVNDWLRTTLCLQYKPHYIAAGSIFLVSKHLKIKLPSANGKAWWMQFDVSPKQLAEVVQHMRKIEQSSELAAMPKPKLASSGTTSGLKPVAQNRKSGTTETCISNTSMVEQDARNHLMDNSPMLSKSAVEKFNQKQPNYDTIDSVHKKDNSLSDSDCTNSVVEDGDAELVNGSSNENTSCKIVSVKESCQNLDITRIRERLKRTKLVRAEKMKSRDNLEDEMLSHDAWIERELEKGIELLE